MRKNFISYIAAAVFALSTALEASAAPLPAGTLLGIDPGVGASFGVPCVTGSCYGTEVFAGLYAWQNISPGTDGGFIVGKAQKCETAPPGPLPYIIPGELTSTFQFPGLYIASFCTDPGGEQNLFDDANCANAGCLGKTELKYFYVADIGINKMPLGSAAGCAHVNCSADQKNGIFITDYQINPKTDGAWSMEYGTVILTGAYQGTRFRLLTRGKVTNNGDPVAIVQPSAIAVMAGDSFTLDGSASYDPDGTIVCHSWSIPGVIVPAVCTPTFSYTVPATTLAETFSVTLTVTDNDGKQGSATATVSVLPRVGCQVDYPIRRITTVGGGGSTAINETMSATFTGHIVSNTKSRFVVCRDTTLDFEVTSTLGQAVCHLNGILVPPQGKLKPNSKLVCSNRSAGGEDFDKYSILSY